MVDKLNISIEDKDTKEIKYILNLDEDWWLKTEYNSDGNIIYFGDSYGYWYKYKYNLKLNIMYYESCRGYWSKTEYNSEAKVIYFEDSDGIIQDDRTN
jgi:hypothetical protein